MGFRSNESPYVADNYTESEPPCIQPMSCRRLGSSSRLGSRGSFSRGNKGSGESHSHNGSNGRRDSPHRSASAPSMTNGGGMRRSRSNSPSMDPVREGRPVRSDQNRTYDDGSSVARMGTERQSTPSSSRALSAIRGIQDVLDFKFADKERHWQFAEKNGLGRVAMLACGLGLILGIHSVLLLLLCVHDLGLSSIGFLDDITPERVGLLRQWLVYVVLLSFFHIAEFFVTAIWNPSVTTADSFVVNQSLAYTTAALVSWAEFWVRFALFPSVNGGDALSVAGFGLVLMGQLCRTLAMVTCGESFNHVIQLAKKDNHKLVNHGIYRYLRHPSYVGFYWWSVGTQLLLGNPLCTMCYAGASWHFFNRRIPYEELTLLRHFPDEYPQYARTSWIGIPFIRSTAAEETKSD
uniref:Protein-S-isoprenylcysteine O-methyltransferase n=1 Tax=Pseudictyota dubia TaxID=2749911 RepID=A0A7R9W1N7_9STRA|mmetsp:Transcript_28417/g.52874  ORF Transcript_28417/g.52874 Transcript_28417/m.52874 type:complete len:407 (+) Transcript_28417:132-1352(+)